MMSCKKPIRALATASAILATVTCAACDGTTPECAGIDVTSLDPSAVVLAASESEGFMNEFGEEFYAGHHGNRATYIFGDGRFITLTRDFDFDERIWNRVWRSGQLAEADFAALLDHAACLDDDDGGEFTSSCIAPDGPGQALSVNVPNADFTASLTFVMADCVPDDWSILPDPALPVIYNSLISLDDTEATAFVPERIVLGGRTMDNEADCPASALVDWPFDTVDLSQLDSESDHILIDAPLAGQVRDFIIANAADNSAEYLNACINVNGTTWMLFYDDAPDEDELLPF